MAIRFHRHTAPFLAGSNLSAEFEHGPHAATGVQVMTCKPHGMGELWLPTGMLLVQDAFLGLGFRKDHMLLLNPGDYPMIGTQAFFGDGHGGRWWAYATIVLDPKAWFSRGEPPLMGRDLVPILMATRAMLDPEDDSSAIYEEQDELLTDSASMVFMDHQVRETLPSRGLEPGEDHWYETLFNTGLPHSWFGAQDETMRHPAGLGTLWQCSPYQQAFPAKASAFSMALMQTGKGDLVRAPLVERIDGKPVAIHWDFSVIPGATQEIRKRYSGETTPLSFDALLKKV